MGCRLGHNADSRHAMYKVGCTSGPNPSVEIISPIAQSLTRVKYMLEGKGGRTRHKSKGPIKRKSRSCSSSCKGSSQRRKKTSREKSQGRKKTNTDKRKKKKKTGKGRWSKKSSAYVPKCVKKNKDKR